MEAHICSDIAPRVANNSQPPPNQWRQEKREVRHRRKFLKELTQRHRRFRMDKKGGQWRKESEEARGRQKNSLKNRKRTIRPRRGQCQPKRVETETHPAEPLEAIQRTPPPITHPDTHQDANAEIVSTKNRKEWRSYRDSLSVRQRTLQCTRRLHLVQRLCCPRDGHRSTSVWTRPAAVLL